MEFKIKVNNSNHITVNKLMFNLKKNKIIKPLSYAFLNRR